MNWIKIQERYPKTAEKDGFIKAFEILENFLTEY